METSIMQIRIDSNLKREATELFEDMGLDLPTAIRIFLKKSVKEKGIPFDLRQRAASNEAINAMLALNKGARRNGTVNLTQSEIDNEIDAAKTALYK
jgi:DNA-damage-inducible protein J